MPGLLSSRFSFLSSPFSFPSSSFSMPRLLITGAGGQVGLALRRAAPEAVALARAALDVTDAEAVREALGRHAPEVVVNAAAYTAVDRAEAEPEAALAVNRDGAAHLAAACAEAGIPLLHLSTDYVFDGRKGAPYRPEDAPRPLGVYGRSKAEGEAAVRERLRRHVILRTSWVFGAEGANFVRSILRLAQEREVLRVVADQRGRPTAAADIAQAGLAMARRMALEKEVPWGTFHFAGTPETTWHGFAEAIVEEARRHVPLAVRRLEAIPTEAYPTPARRPADSRLDTSATEAAWGLAPPPWREALGRVVAELLS